MTDSKKDKKRSRSKTRTRRRAAIHRFRIGKKLLEGESGKQDELNNEEARRKIEPRAAEDRPKSTERHSGDA